MKPVASTELYFLASFAGGGSHVTGFWPVEYPEWVEVMDTDSLFDP